MPPFVFFLAFSPLARNRHRTDGFAIAGYRGAAFHPQVIDGNRNSPCTRAKSHLALSDPEDPDDGCPGTEPEGMFRTAANPVGKAYAMPHPAFILFRWATRHVIEDFLGSDELYAVAGA